MKIEPKSFIYCHNCGGDGNTREDRICPACNGEGGKVKLQRYQPETARAYGCEPTTCDYRTPDGRFEITRTWSRGSGNAFQVRETSERPVFRGRNKNNTYIYNADTLAEIREEIAIVYLSNR